MGRRILFVPRIARSSTWVRYFGRATSHPTPLFPLDFGGIDVPNYGIVV